LQRSPTSSWPLFLVTQRDLQTRSSISNCLGMDCTLK
jgi:hypothetical protein